MKSGQVLQFPESKTARVRAQNRVRNQKVTLALSILSVVVLSVITNQYISKPMFNQFANNGSRSIASVHELNKITTEEIQWEHELAKQLGESEMSQGNNKSFLAEEPTLQEQLLYGDLEGLYGASFREGKLLSLKLKDENTISQATLLDNREYFLKKYQDLISVPHARIGLASSSQSKEVWNLISEDRTVVGQVAFEFDEKGHLLSLVVE